MIWQKGMSVHIVEERGSGIEGRGSGIYSPKGPKSDP